MNECMTQEDAEKMSNQQAASILKPLRDMMRDQHGCPISDAYFALDKAIDVLTAEPKKGRWRQGGYACGETEWICSECGFSEWRTSNARMKFCMNCGARMDGE